MPLNCVIGQLAPTISARIDLVMQHATWTANEILLRAAFVSGVPIPLAVAIPLDGEELPLEGQPLMADLFTIGGVFELVEVRFPHPHSIYTQTIDYNTFLGSMMRMTPAVGKLVIEKHLRFSTIGGPNLGQSRVSYAANQVIIGLAAQFPFPIPDYGGLSTAHMRSYDGLITLFAEVFSEMMIPQIIVFAHTYADWQTVKAVAGALSHGAFWHLVKDGRASEANRRAAYHRARLALRITRLVPLGPCPVVCGLVGGPVPDWDRQINQNRAVHLEREMKLATLAREYALSGRMPVCSGEQLEAELAAVTAE